MTLVTDQTVWKYQYACPACFEALLVRDGSVVKHRHGDILRCPNCKTALRFVLTSSGEIAPEIFEE